MSKLAALREELAGYEDDLNTCIEYLALEPDDADSKDTKTLLEEQIVDVKARIAEEESRQQATAPPPPPPPPTGSDIPPPPPKYDMTRHPKFLEQSHDAPPPLPPDEQQSFHVKDVVMAKWSEDKQWYQATVVSKTGSSADPVYTVTFKGYNNTETKRKHEIKPVHVTESKKRKADGSPAVSSTNTNAATASPAAPTNTIAVGHVISAAPAVNTSLMPPKREPSKVSDGPTRMAPEPKKLKGQKQLAKNQEGWKAFQAVGPKKAALGGGGGGGGGAVKQKDSMLRTPDNPKAKVGFTGSGKAMQKDPAMKRWNYKDSVEDD
ncbi:hypothetical protein BAUCODRAFT_336774 [Baudoinia panamericana UAMH 10762]|uniref:Tudor domain-containing protein n=1 Tax=Baudoinia panamericana (strain UAMH 10762) TaxID=717646 RepID=M2NJ69_BAUPA|nr:uncharacterized protein BAUCODRAFT_336774 [Baudoinia panamericana UAMH 10762]EMC99439.1 hypothetical protein BAUCODRAFT_336774 [Baudoinia panamericana UAMH 10762]